MKKVRESNFELLRIVSMLMVLLMHVCSQVKGGEAGLSFANAQFSHLVNAVCNTGVSCFVLISGWFGIRFKASRLVDLIVISVVFTFALSCVQNGFSDIKALMTPVLDLFKYQKWFLACYVVLYCIAPYLNSYMEKTERKEWYRLLITLYILIGFVPTLFQSPNGSIIHNSGKQIAYFVFLYMLGRYMRKYHDVDVPRRNLFAILGGSTLIMMANYLCADLFHTPRPNLVGDSSPFILASALSIFYLFRSLHFRSWLVNYMAGSVLVVYIIETFRMTIDPYIGVADAGFSPYYPLLVIAESLAVFLTAVVGDKVFQLLYSPIKNNSLIPKTLRQAQDKPND